MRREKTGNPQWREWERLQAQGRLSMYFNNDEVAATCPAKVKICALQRGSEAKGLYTYPEKLIFNVQHLHLLLFSQVQASALGGEEAPGTEVHTGMSPEMRQEEQLVP